MKIIVATILILLGFSEKLTANDDHIAKANGIDIWFETFGQQDDPALLLIMGACAQGILWPTEFCQQLADQGFYVIRYDHRDAGLSTCFKFKEQPYDLLDMAKDAVGLLNFLEIKTAHVFGLSMGGPIAELMVVHYPNRILSVILMATSCDFRPLHRAIDGLPPQDGSLSGPKENYIAAIKQVSANPPKTREEWITQKLERWRLLNGSIVPFEEDLYLEVYKQFFIRLKYPEAANNHLLANRNSEELICTTPSKLHMPTLILHGSEDPIFPPDHGQALSIKIPDSKFVFVEGMGHILNRHFYDLVVKEIKLLAELVDNNPVNIQLGTL